MDITGTEWIKQVRDIAEERMLFDGDRHMIREVFCLNWMSEYLLGGMSPEEAVDAEVSTWKEDDDE